MHSARWRWLKTGWLKNVSGMQQLTCAVPRPRGFECVFDCRAISWPRANRCNSRLRSRIASVLGCLRTVPLPHQKQPGTEARARSVTAGEASRPRKVATKATARRGVSCTVVASFTCTLDAMHPQSGAAVLFILCYFVCQLVCVHS